MGCSGRLSIKEIAGGVLLKYLLKICRSQSPVHRVFTRLTLPVSVTPMKAPTHHVKPDEATNSAHVHDAVRRGTICALIVSLKQINKRFCWWRWWLGDGLAAELDGSLCPDSLLQRFSSLLKQVPFKWIFHHLCVSRTKNDGGGKTYTPTDCSPPPPPLPHSCSQLLFSS